MSSQTEKVDRMYLSKWPLAQNLPSSPHLHICNFEDNMEPLVGRIESIDANSQQFQASSDESLTVRGSRAWWPHYGAKADACVEFSANCGGIMQFLVLWAH